MEFLFLGTGAADFSPQEVARTDGFSKEVRRASAALAAGRILIDCGPHALGALHLAGVDPAGITDLLLTHTHADHLHLPSVASLAGLTAAPLHIWCDGGAADALTGVEKATVHAVNTADCLLLRGINATPLAANHRTDRLGEQPLHWILEKQGKSLFYGCDGAWLRTDTFYQLRGRSLDLMVLDGTVGDQLGDERVCEHNSLAMVRLLLPSLRQAQVVAPNGRILISHLAATLHPSHAEVSAALRPAGIGVAYDGLTLRI